MHYHYHGLALHYTLRFLSFVFSPSVEVSLFEAGLDRVSVFGLGCLLHTHVYTKLDLQVSMVIIKHTSGVLIGARCADGWLFGWLAKLVTGPGANGLGFFALLRERN